MLIATVCEQQIELILHLVGEDDQGVFIDPLQDLGLFRIDSDAGKKLFQQLGADSPHIWGRLQLKWA